MARLPSQDAIHDARVLREAAAALDWPTAAPAEIVGTEAEPFMRRGFEIARAALLDLAKNLLREPEE